MLRGLYTAAAGMIAEQRRHDAVTNNIANLNTPGYKQANTQLRSFPETLLYLVNGGEDAPPSPIGWIDNGVMAEENVTSYQQGDMFQTKAPTDLALISNVEVMDGQGNPIPFDADGRFVTAQGETLYQPQAFFTIETGNPADPQRRYTRNGSFQINQNGELLTSAGDRVLGVDGQPIVIAETMSDVTVLPDGEFVDARTSLPIQDANGNNVQLLLSQIDNPNLLRPEGNGLFKLDDAAPQPGQVNAAYISVRQGYIERSNVNATQSMVDMMTALRAYEANQKVIQYFDRSLDKAVNEVGKV